MKKLYCPYCNTFMALFGILAFASPLLAPNSIHEQSATYSFISLFVSTFPVINIIAKASKNPWIVRWSFSFSMTLGLICGSYVGFYVSRGWLRVNPIERWNIMKNRVTGRTIWFVVLGYLFFLWLVSGDYIRAIITDLGYHNNSFVFNFLPSTLGFVSGHQVLSDTTKANSLTSFFYYAPYDTSALMIASCAEFFYLVVSLTLFTISFGALASFFLLCLKKYGR
ncbi:hypothetical protein [Acidithiobacillus sulfuriphilus]|uniref:hypothetical protein n=1 Tax=Acidithiobacillus sulfuriphilus TaxID=1867749 RepID=UPI003F6078E9